MSSRSRISRSWVVSMRTKTSSSPPKLLLPSSNPLNPFLPSRNPLKLLPPSYRPEGTKASSFTYLPLTRTANSVLWPRSTSSASQVCVAILSCVHLVEHSTGSLTLFYLRPREYGGTIYILHCKLAVVFFQKKLAVVQTCCRGSGGARRCGPPPAARSSRA